MSSSEEHDLDLSFEEVLRSRINSLERFAIEQISDVMETHQDLQEKVNNKMMGDMAAIKFELEFLKSYIADQDQVIEELRKQLEVKGSSAPTHSEVQDKWPASSERGDNKQWRIFKGHLEGGLGSLVHHNNLQAIPGKKKNQSHPS